MLLSATHQPNTIIVVTVVVVDIAIIEINNPRIVAIVSIGRGRPIIGNGLCRFFLSLPSTFHLLQGVGILTADTRINTGGQRAQ